MISVFQPGSLSLLIFKTRGLWHRREGPLDDLCRSLTENSPTWGDRGMIPAPEPKQPIAMLQQKPFFQLIKTTAFEVPGSLRTLDRGFLWLSSDAALGLISMQMFQGASKEPIAGSKRRHPPPPHSWSIDFRPRWHNSTSLITAALNTGKISSVNLLGAQGMRELRGGEGKRKPKSKKMANGPLFRVDDVLVADQLKTGSRSFTIGIV